MSEFTSFASLLLARPRGTDHGASGDVLRRFEKVLLLFARRHFPADLQAKGSASDLVQDTFLDAQRDFPHFAGTTEGELLAWLRCLLRHNISNFETAYRRREKRRIGREQPLLSDSRPLLERQQLVARKRTGERRNTARVEQFCAAHLLQLPGDFAIADPPEIRREIIVSGNWKSDGYHARGSPKAAWPHTSQTGRQTGLRLKFADDSIPQGSAPEENQTGTTNPT